MLESLRLKHVDVVGYHAGSLAAVEFAIARPEQVRRVALIGVPRPTAAVTRWANACRSCSQPVMIMRARDEFWESTGRTDPLLREARRVELQHPTGAVFEAGAEE